MPNACCACVKFCVIFAPNLLVAIASRLPLVLFRLRLPKANQALVARSGISNELGMEQPEVSDEPRAGSASRQVLRAFVRVRAQRRG